ncbi:hypothetical protein ACFRAE_13425 [Sphingobacterium sp. HJSM2_6]|uniref:hypothetical protein n=1 Tax=Sphingobacterium sp. HJSM2_6 TaxID=3366264 RepID=UPI003BC17A51
MLGKVIVSKFWTQFFSLGKAQAITIFPFIFLLHKNDRQNKTLLNHERIHIYQALELLVIPFYVWYLTEFLVRLILVQNVHRAYLEISFEQEAYKNDQDMSYLQKRKVFDFLKYLS